MFGSHTPQQKSGARRALIREKCPDTSALAWLERQRCKGVLPSVAIAAVFWVLAASILMLRENVLPYRPGQAVRSDVFARADFGFPDEGVRVLKTQQARAETPRVYRAAPTGPAASNRAAGDAWQPLEDRLLSLPDAVAGLTYDQLPPDLQRVLDHASVTALQQYARAARPTWTAAVGRYVASLRQANWVVLPADQRAAELQLRHGIVLLAGARPGDRPAAELAADQTIDAASLATATVPAPADDELTARLQQWADDCFRAGVRPKVVALTLNALRPTFVLDDDQTVRAQNTAAEAVRPEDCVIRYRRNEPIVHQAMHQGIIDGRDWQVLQAEHRAFLSTVAEAVWRQRLGVAVATLVLTLTLAAYVAHFQPRVMKNHARAVAIAALMLSMLLLAELAGLGTGPIFLFAVAPTLLVGMILTIAYDQRFARRDCFGHPRACWSRSGSTKMIEFLLVIWIGLDLRGVFCWTDVRIPQQAGRGGRDRRRWR